MQQIKSTATYIMGRQTLQHVITTLTINTKCLSNYTTPPHFLSIATFEAIPTLQLQADLTFHDTGFC